MNRLQIALTIILAGLAAGSAAAEPFSCDVRVVSAIDGNKNTMTGKVISDTAGRFRLELYSVRGVRITIRNGEDIWTYDPNAAEGLHYRAKQGTDAAGAGSLYFDKALERFVKSGGKRVRTETLEGQKCEVYVRSPRQGVTETLWVMADATKRPFRVRVVSKVRAAKQLGQPMTDRTITRTTDYRNWKTGIQIAAEQFRPPKGVQFREAESGGLVGRRQ